MKKVLIAAGLLAALTLADAKAADPKPGLLIGGAITCQELGSTTDRKEQIFHVGWAMGYWSGLNVQSGRMVGKGISTKQIVDKIDEVCRLDPTQNLQYAVNVVYALMAKLQGINIQ
jgi:hypothetical protein